MGVNADWVGFGAEKTCPVPRLEVCEGIFVTSLKRISPSQSTARCGVIVKILDHNSGGSREAAISAKLRSRVFEKHQTLALKWFICNKSS